MHYGHILGRHMMDIYIYTILPVYVYTFVCIQRRKVCIHKNINTGFDLAAFAVGPQTLRLSALEKQPTWPEKERKNHLAIAIKN